MDKQDFVHKVNLLQSLADLWEGQCGSRYNAISNISSEFLNLVHSDGLEFIKEQPPIPILTEVIRKEIKDPWVEYCKWHQKKFSKQPNTPKLMTPLQFDKYLTWYDGFQANN